jgi:hypothetical protein
MEEDLIMAPNLLFYQLLMVILVLSCFMIHVWWPKDKITVVSQILVRRRISVSHPRSMG